MNDIANYQPFTAKYELNDTNQNVLTCLSRYAVKHPNVAYLKVATIADSVNKSNRTVRRTIKIQGRLRRQSTESSRRNYRRFS